MSAFLPIVLSILALSFLSHGVATIWSARYFQRWQKVVGLWAPAPPTVNERKYYLINRIIAGLCSVGCGVIVVSWILQYLGRVGS